MGDLTGIFVIGFLVLGTYKIVELVSKRKERLMFIEKFFTHCEKKDISGSFNLPDFSFEKKDNSSWALRISLLLIGVGIGCLLAFFTIFYFKYSVHAEVNDNIQSFISFSYISIFGGLGLFTSYLIESKQSKNK